MRQKLLALSADFGSGHRAAARALASAWERDLPGGEAVALQVEHPLLSVVSDGYLGLIRHAPSAYRRIYQHEPGNGMRRVIRSALTSRILAAVNDTSPTAIVATHPFPGIACAHLRRSGRLPVPFAMVLTDFLPHPLWVHDGVDRYFVASQMAAERLEALGAKAHRIRVTGIPIQAGFHRQTSSHPRLPRILVMGGGMGLGPIVAAVKSLSSASPAGWVITVLCGSNDSLRHELNDRFPAIEALGYTDQVHQLMAEADLLVTKPGGLSCSEALAAGLPMLLLDPLPGHEEENAAYLASTGGATCLRAEHTGFVAAKLLFERRDLLNQMRLAVTKCGRPRAADSIVQELALLERPGTGWNHLLTGRGSVAMPLPDLDSP